MHTEIVTAAIPILINHKVLLEDVDKWLAKRRQIYRPKSLSYVFRHIGLPVTASICGRI